MEYRVLHGNMNTVVYVQPHLVSVVQTAAESRLRRLAAARRRPHRITSTPSIHRRRLAVSRPVFVVEWLPRQAARL